MGGRGLGAGGRLGAWAERRLRPNPVRDGERRRPMRKAHAGRGKSAPSPQAGPTGGDGRSGSRVGPGTPRVPGGVPATHGRP